MTLAYWAAAWIPMLAALVLLLRNGKTAGLILAYALQLVILHWLAAVLYLLPWYEYLDESVVLAGLQQSTYAIVGLTMGAAVTFLFLRQQHAMVSPTPYVLVGRRLLWMCLGVGTVSYFILTPLLARAPTLAAIAAAGSSCAVVGLVLGSWNGSHRRTLWKWGAVTAVLPFVTIVIQGFLGYGLAAALVVFAFVAAFHRPRWQVVAFGVAAAYLGLSMYVTYMRDRADIRQVVWGGEPASARIERLAETFSSPELFDLNDPEHLYRVDQRLNTNYLVGSAVMYLHEHPGDFARGETLIEALLAPVPRIFWPDKPMVAGSGDLVSRFTGIQFREGTSVGIGQVMELYVNFGEWGVFLGFIVIGAILTYVDRAAAVKRDCGDWPRFLLWFLPGICLLQAGGSLVEVTASAGAAWIVAFALSRVSASSEPSPAPFPLRRPVVHPRPESAL